MPNHRITLIKISATGAQLPIEATEWDAVLAPELGLMFSADNASDKPLSEKDADAACAALTLGGFTDWQLPSDRRDLEAILDLSKECPAIDERFFRNTKNSWYRTKHAVAGSSGLVWIVGFSLGGVNGVYRGDERWVRAVRVVSPAGQ
jgi:hypothetical protein